MYVCAHTMRANVRAHVHTHENGNGRKMSIMADVGLREFDYYKKKSKFVRRSWSEFCKAALAFQAAQVTGLLHQTT